MMRRALERAPLLKPQIEDVPFDGGLVGTTGYDVVRFFERLPPNHARAQRPAASGLRRARVAARVRSPDAPRRVAARGQRSPSDKRCARRSSTRCAAASTRRSAAQFGAGRRQHDARQSYMRGRAEGQGAHQSRRHLSDRAVGALLGPHATRSVPGLPRLAPAESVAVHVLTSSSARYASRAPRPRRSCGSPAAARAAPDRGHKAARRDARARRGARDRAARRPEGERRARDARRPRAQRLGPRRARSGSVHVDPYRKIERYSHVMHIVSGVQGLRRARTRTRSICSRPRSRPARSSARRRCARCSSSPSSSRARAASTAARSATSRRTATWTRRSRSARWCSTATSTASRPAPASSRTACRRPNTRKCSRRARSCAGARARGGGPVSARLLLIDNYDSFTYNLVQAFLVLGPRCSSIATTRSRSPMRRTLAPTHLVISPGPGRPDDAGVSLDMIARVRGQGAGARRVPRAPEHRAALRRRDHRRRRADARQDLARAARRRRIYRGIAEPVRGRPLSLARSRTARSCPPSSIVTARTTEGEIMGVRHRTLHGRRRAVPSRERAHARGPELLENFLYR